MKFLSLIIFALLQVSLVFANYDLDEAFTDDERAVLESSIQDALAEKYDAARVFQPLRNGELPPNLEDIIKRLLGSKVPGMTEEMMTARIRAFTHFATAHWFGEIKWHTSPSRRVQYVRKLEPDRDSKGKKLKTTTLKFTDPVTGRTAFKTFRLPKEGELGTTYHHEDIDNHAIVAQELSIYKNTDRASDYSKDYRSGVEILRDGVRTFMMRDMFDGQTINRVLPHEDVHVPEGPDGYAVVQDAPIEDGEFLKILAYSLKQLFEHADANRDLTRNAEFYNHIMRWNTLSHLGVKITENGNIPLDQFAQIKRAPDSGKFMRYARTRYPKLKIQKSLCSRDGSCGLDTTTTDADQNSESTGADTRHKTNPSKPSNSNSEQSDETDRNPEEPADDADATTPDETDRNPVKLAGGTDGSASDNKPAAAKGGKPKRFKA